MVSLPRVNQIRHSVVLMPSTGKSNSWSVFAGNQGGAALVYFGTCSVYDPSSITTPYVCHKRRMEDLVTNSGSSYVIFRLPQIVGRSGNKNTLLNFLHNKIVNEQPFDLWQEAIRYLVDIDDVVKFVRYVLDQTEHRDLTVNLRHAACRMVDIVTRLEQISGKKADFRAIDRGATYTIPETRGITGVHAGIEPGDQYANRVIYKYFASGTVVDKKRKISSW